MTVALYRAPFPSLSRGVQAVFACPSESCGRLFLALYHEHPVCTDQCQLVALDPRTPPRVKLPETITTASPGFQRVFEQALAAETFSLDQVAGGGFRKALELLVKDYCISRRPQSALAIKAALLGPCIENFVDSQKVKDTAKRAAWLGNDELHYERVWTDKDLSHLKDLLRLTMNWIDDEATTAKYVGDMPVRKDRGAGPKPAGA